MAAEHRVEGEGAPGLGEEPLGAGLPGDPPPQGHGGEVRRREGAGPALPGEQRGAHALGPVLEQGGEHVGGPHEGDGAAAEVADVVGDGEGGELRHRVGRAHRGRPHEDPALEAVGEPRRDAVGADGGHYSARTGAADRRVGPRRAVGKTSSSVRG